MKKYLRSAGFRHTNNNDLKDKEFYLSNVSFATSEKTVVSSVVLDRVETYTLFLKDFNGDTLGTKFASAINEAMIDGVDVLNDFAFEAERVENGFEIQITFIIKG